MSVSSFVKRASLFCVIRHIAPVPDKMVWGRSFTPGGEESYLRGLGGLDIEKNLRRGRSHSLHTQLFCMKWFKNRELKPKPMSGSLMNEDEE